MKLSCLCGCIVNHIVFAVSLFVMTNVAFGCWSATFLQLWLLTWQDAGAPDLSIFQRYYYPMKRTLFGLIICQENNKKAVTQNVTAFQS